MGSSFWRHSPVGPQQAPNWWGGPILVSTKLEVNKPFVTKEPALGISFQYQQRDQAMGHWNLSIFPGKAKVLPEVLLSCYTADSSAPADQTTLILHTNGPRGSFPWETSQGRPPSVLLRLLFKAPREHSIGLSTQWFFWPKDSKSFHSPPQTMVRSVPAILLCWYKFLS